MEQNDDFIIIDEHTISESGLSKSPLEGVWEESINILIGFEIMELKFYEDNIFSINMMVSVFLQNYQYMTSYFFGTMTHTAIKCKGNYIHNDIYGKKSVDIIANIYLKNFKKTMETFVIEVNKDLAKLPGEETIVYNDTNDYSLSDDVRRRVNEVIEAFVKKSKEQNL